VKYLITNCHSDKQRGDLAIIVSLVGIISHADPSATFVMVFGGGTASFAYEESTMLRAMCPAVRVIPAPIDFRNLPLGSFAKKLRTIVHDAKQLSLSLLTLLSPRVTQLRFADKLLGTNRGFVKELAEANLVVDRGGGFIYYSPRSKSIYNTARALLYLYRVLFPTLVAQRMNIPYVFAGHSIWDLDDAVAGFLAKKTLKKSKLIAVREKISQIYLRKRFKLESQTVPDLAFYVDYSSDEQMKIDDRYFDCQCAPIPRRKFLSVTVRQAIFGQKREVYQAYLESLTAFFSWYLSHHSEHKIAIVAQVTGPTPDENDLLAMADLRKMLPSNVARKTHFIEEKLTPGQLENQ